MREGIPNLSTPADIFDRLIIERLKLQQFSCEENIDNKKIESAEFCVAALKTEVAKLIAETQGTISNMIDYFDNLIIAVATVSYCENEKAVLHKNDGNENIISALDRTSRKANENRAFFKRKINELFEITTGKKNLEETRTFEELNDD